MTAGLEYVVFAELLKIHIEDISKRLDTQRGGQGGLKTTAGSLRWLSSRMCWRSPGKRAEGEQTA